MIILSSDASHMVLGLYFLLVCLYLYVCAHTTKEPTIAGHQGSVDRFIQCSAHKAKTGASMKHVEVD